MSCNKMNQSCGLSYDETLFLGCQQVPKVKIACNLIKISSNNIFSDIFGHNIFSLFLVVILRGHSFIFLYMN